MTFTARPAAVAPGPWHDSRHRCVAEGLRACDLSLKVKSTGGKECAWQAPQFVNFIWLHKIEINKVEIKASHIYEIEIEREGPAIATLPPSAPRTCPSDQDPYWRPEAASVDTCIVHSVII